jgi:5,5'-dehydrodivanillate O-demethylase
LEYGIVEEYGLRCPYQGCLIDETGQCVEQPVEAADSTFKDRIKMKSYPVEVLGGLIFAYMGPEPRLLLPRWEWLVDDHAYRQVNFLVLPCN